MNEKGDIVIPIKYDSVEEFREGLAAIKRNGKYGFINEKGEIVIPIEYVGIKY